MAQDNEEQDTLTTPATASRLRAIAAALRLDEGAFYRALALAGQYPDKAAWARAVERALLISGAALIIAGVASFFAYNWAGLHKFAKFGLIQFGMIAAVFVAWRKGPDSPSGKAALFAAAFLTGILLAVYGQVYQTGADPYGLFLGWALLILGWALIGRQPGIWLLMVVLANLTLILYWTQVLNPPANWTGELARAFGPAFWLSYMVSDFRLAQWVFALNAVALVAWEFLSARRVSWMVGRWVPRVLAVFALTVIVISTVIIIFSSHYGIHNSTPWLNPLLFFAFIGVALWFYQRRRHDLFVLAACMMSIIVVVTSVVARGMPKDVGSLLFLSLLVVGQTAAAATWLRHVAASWRNAE